MMMKNCFCMFKFNYLSLIPQIFPQKMREIFPGQWPVVTILTTLMFIFFVGKFLCSKRKNPEKISYKFPPGRRGWPLVGDSFNFYNAVAGSHPPSFVREQVKRYKIYY